jgi:HEAT repeat protein
MKNISDQTQRQTYKNSFFLIKRGLIVIFLIFSTFGCQSPEKQLGAFNSNNMTTVQSEAFQIVGQSLADNDAIVRVNAIEVVATAKLYNLMPRVQQLLQDGAMPVRFAAALAVGDMKYSPAKNIIINNKMLKDPDNNVILAASYALTRLGYPGYVEVLRKSITDTNPTVRANAAMLLGKSGDRESLKLLYWALQDKDSDDRAVYQAAEAIAMLGDESIYPKLWAMLISAYADVRVVGIRAMGTLGTKKAEDALITMLDDDVLEVRLAAAEQLGRLNNPAGESKVLEAFKKNLTNQMDLPSRERVYVMTALAIGQIGTPELTKYLPELMENDSKFVRLAAAKAVFQSKTR